jgi:putative DNA primase/helicase
MPEHQATSQSTTRKPIKTRKNAANGLTLDDLIDLRRWVAWRSEPRERQNGTIDITKLPYDPNSKGMAEVPTNPATWGSREQAERRWQELDDGRPGGVGIVLGDLGGGLVLLGIDLDGCLGDSGIADWALKIIERFNSYSEISPSGNGVKIFFVIAASDLGTVRPLFGKNTDGKWKWRRTFNAGKGREVAIDRGRFYAVTDTQLINVPKTLEVVDSETIKWFIEVAGPAYQKAHKPPGSSRTKTRGHPSKGPLDLSGSGHGFRFLGDRKRAGDTFQQACAAIKRDQGEAGQWARERADERQLERAYQRQRASDTTAAPDLIMLPAGAPLKWAAAFAASPLVRGRLVHYRGNIYQWVGTHYEICDDADLRSLIYRFLDQTMIVQEKGAVPFNPDQSKVNKTIDALRGTANESASCEAPFWLDDEEHPNPADLIACRNGLLDLTTRQLLPHTPALFNVNHLPFDYDPQATAPQWLTFLQQIWPGDQGSDGEQCEATMQETFGLLVTPDTSLQKMFMWVGRPRSGKGTVARVLTALLGSVNIVYPTLAQVGGEFGLESWINKRVTIFADARLGQKTNASAVVERLLSLSGEDKQSINRKFAKFWNGALQARVVIITNELPRATDASGAFASRFIVIPFVQSFLNREDPQLSSRLYGELPGILNWALDGLQRLRERGHFVMPQSALAEVRQLEDLTSPVRSFVRDCCVIDGERQVNVKLLYLGWKTWCEQQGHPPGSSQTFGRDLHAASPQVRVRGKRPNSRYHGIALSPEGRESLGLGRE